jgi:large subunit ribosomal protein L7/L12
MAKTTTEKLLGAFEEMTILELSEFLKAFEEKFDVTAAAPVAVAAVAVGADVDEVVEEQVEFDVVLTGPGQKKIQVIKEVRSLTSLGLKEAKALVDDAPSAILEGVDRETADKAKDSLEAAGGEVELK